MNRTTTAEVNRERLVTEGPTGPVPGILYRPEVPREGVLPLVLLGHGGGGSKDDPRMTALAERFAHALGAGVLVIDGPVHGERQPTIEDPEERFRATRRALSDPATPARMAADWQAALTTARQIAGGTGPVGYVGFSMGTILGVPTVAAMTEITAAVFALGGIVRPGGVPDVARAAGLSERIAAIIAEEDDPEARNAAVREAAVRLGGREVLMLSMTEDEAFPLEGALELFSLLPGPKRMGLWPGGHLQLPAEAIDLAIRFLHRHLLGQGPVDDAAGAW